MKRLDKTIQEHYTDKRLSDSAIDRILAMGDDAKHAASQQDSAAKQSSTTPQTNTSRHWWSQINSWQVASLVFFTAIIAGVIIGKNDSVNANISELVLEEIAMNHNKRLRVEFPIKEFKTLQTAMARLDFKLLRPDELSTNFQLLGGRYCSIQGKLAAQLKIMNINNKKIATLYITPTTKRLADIKAQDTVTDNVNIKLWKAGKFLYGLATDTN